MNINKIQKIANKIRKRVLDFTLKNNGGYLSQACSSAEIFACLYTKIMKLKPFKKPLMPEPFNGVPSTKNKKYIPGYYFTSPHESNLDRFILSPTHYSLVLYATLIETGRLDEKSLEFFNKDGSSLEMIGAEHSPGMEVMTGSLGQGLSQAVGMALGRKFKKEKGKIWVLMSDGEFQIGMVWESFQFMSHYKLDNIIILIDFNKNQCDGPVKTVMQIEPLRNKLISFGAKVISINGHNIKELLKASKVKHINKPLVILCHTDACKGINELRKKEKLHYIRFKNEEEKKQYLYILKRLENE